MNGLDRVRSSVGLDEPDHDVRAALEAPSSLVEHREGLSDAGRSPEVDPEPPGCLDDIDGVLVDLNHGCAAHDFSFYRRLAPCELPPDGSASVPLRPSPQSGHREDMRLGSGLRRRDAQIQR